MIWADFAARYDAFLSYSWKSDSEVAPVIQSVLQRFLCPWYRLRAKTIFRDLSSLPAGSSLENELFARLDRSVHLIVLACPAAAQSRGMEMEARHWFSRHRDGQILIIVTAGECDTWQKIREHLLPPAIRDNLAGAALWASIRHHRDAILENPNSHKLRGELIEDLRQIFLRLYPMSDWGTIARCGACPAATRCRILIASDDKTAWVYRLLTLSDIAELLGAAKVDRTAASLILGHSPAGSLILTTQRPCEISGATPLDITLLTTDRARLPNGLGDQ